MEQPSDSFYDNIAAVYHLIFADWDAAIERQQAILSRLLPPPANAGVVLDCACGIGTQALGLAQAGYRVQGTDLSIGGVERAKVEAAARKLDVSFRVDDMRLLQTSAVGVFGAVIAFDNALPHLDSDGDIRMAFAAIRDRLRPAGRLLVSLRDYKPLMEQRPTMTPPSLFWDSGRRRIVHQVWDWKDERRYVMHLYITRETRNGRWNTQHFIGQYRAITLHEVAEHATQVGLRQVEVLQPSDTGYYQPIVAAVR